MTFVISDTAMIVEYRKNKKMTQAEVAIKMATTQSAVARLEKRLLNGEDVMLSALQRYSSALGLDLQWAIRPKRERFGIFDNAEEAIAFAVHSSLCEGLETPPQEIDNLKRLAKGEITGKELIRQYVQAALIQSKELPHV